VKNNPARLGPSRGVPRTAPALSPSRAALLRTLQAQSEPTTVGALTSATGLHHNTVREHLEALVEHGLATRFPAQPSGRGRPAWLYEATSEEPGPGSEYAGLAVTLAESIARRSPAPVEDALEAGRGWGHDLARRRGPAQEGTATAARRQVVGLLDDLGFGPESDARARSVRLTRCPLLEAAHKFPDVVCGVHLGLTQGALAEYGADPAGARLTPFAEPGACRLLLAANR
jgi:predicted ArsR family transcriptional regulator